MYLGTLDLEGGGSDHSDAAGGNPQPALRDLSRAGERT